MNISYNPTNARCKFTALVLVAAVISGCAVSESRTSTPITKQPTSKPTQTESDDTAATDAASVNGDTETQTLEEPSDAATENKLTKAGTIQATRLREASGMAFSGNEPGLIWLVNDSGNAAELFAVDTTGRHLATVKLDTRNRDWEDLSQFNLNGESFLLIADIGDNLRTQKQYRLHIVSEPQLDTRSVANSATSIAPVVSLDLTFPDGSHNSEAAAVANDGYLYLITKASQPAVYRAPLVETFSNWLNRPTASSITDVEPVLPLQAEFIGRFRKPTLTPALALIKTLTGVDLGSVTALDFDSNLGEAWILTYRSIYRLPATASGDWQAVMTGKPERFTGHDLAQAEALAFSPNGQYIYATSEGVGSRLLKIRNQ